MKHLARALLCSLALPLGVGLGCTTPAPGGAASVDAQGGSANADGLSASGDSAPATTDSGALAATDTSAAPQDAPPSDLFTPSDTAPTEGCGCNPGAIKGLVCAPNAQVFVNGAAVTVTGQGCDGAPYEATTTSSAKGEYNLTGVPCGTVHVSIDKGSYHHEYNLQVPPNGVADVTAVGKKQCFKAGATKIAVISGDWDDLEGVLSGLGFDFDDYSLYDGGDWQTGDWLYAPAYDLLTDPAKMAEYAVIFINCGGAHKDMVTSTPQITANIKSFVENGGSLYVSDWAYVYVEWPWPGAIDFYGDDSSGDPMSMNGNQKVPGTVVDTALAAQLGTGVITVHYDLGPLVAVEATAADTVEHVIGFVAQFGTVQPLAMSFRPTPGAGHVVYTNFHNEAQGSAVMQTVLNYLVFNL